MTVKQKKIIFILVLFFTFNVNMYGSMDIQPLKEVSNNASLTTAKDNIEDDEFDEFEDEFQTKEIFDPLSGYNRVMTTFNDDAYEYVLKPVSKGYKFVVYKEIRVSIKNFFHNIFFFSRFVNNLLQLKFNNAFEETQRFVLNSTIGVLGLFDPAKSQFGIKPHEEDFGQTLGFYGIAGGPHIVLPLFGPSNLRDAISIYPDSFLNPVYNNEIEWYSMTDSHGEYIAVKVFETVNKTSLNIDSYDKLKEGVVDLYPYLRDIYEQRREQLIKE